MGQDKENDKGIATSLSNLSTTLARGNRGAHLLYEVRVIHTVRTRGYCEALAWAPKWVPLSLISSLVPALVSHMKQFNLVFALCV